MTAKLPDHAVWQHLHMQLEKQLERDAKFRAAQSYYEGRMNEERVKQAERLQRDLETLKSSGEKLEEKTGMSECLPLQQSKIATELGI